ncbi:cytochrome P450 [Lentithecium fluviatile CBS 122367]|uniref:Cytochrome P450 monooxygenase ABA1 n=1 Tax=Lentithecium fluviatile CBS 122367 TaxID=1168545 RepID=A0A6G1IE94_9PLEO|nr:cytochrome P450 [Lentithecium fluviatile CBS 122367]
MASESLLGVAFKFLLPFFPAILVVWYVVSSFQTWYRLRHIPGPFLGKFSYLFMLKTQASGKQHFTFREVNAKYGSLARIGPNELTTNDPELIRRMSAARSTYFRSDWYRGMRLDPHTDNVLSERDVKVHDERRAKMAGAYAGRENPQLEKDVDDQIAAWCNLIRTKYISTGETLKPMDIATQVQYFTLDVITSLAYGKAFGYLAQDTDVFDYIKTGEQLVATVATIMGIAPIQNFLYNTNLIFRVAPHPEDPKGLGKMMAVAREVVGERFGPDAKAKQDMLGAFVRNGIPQKQIEAEILIQIMAGSDTTASGLRSTFLRLLTSSRALTKLRAEIDAAIADGRASSPIQQSEAKELPYLQAVIKEGLRINPPFLGQLSKEVPAGGDTYNGIYLPAGTRIGHNTFSLMRQPLFGADVDMFRPERWLEAEPETRREMEKTLELVFGYGRWGCLGKSVAYLEMDKVYFELLRQFDFDIVNSEKPWHSENYNIWMQHGFYLRVTERESAKSQQ